MSSLYRRNDIYWLSFRYHGKAQCISLGTKDRTTAIYLKAQKDQELTEGRYIIRQDVPCEEVLKEYMEASQHRKTQKTNDDDESRIKAFLAWSGITRMNQITEKKLQEYLNHRINDNKLTLSSANRLIATFKAWLNFAVRRKIIFENPIKYFKGYNPGVRHPKYLSVEDVKKIIEAAQGSRVYYPILTGLYTGMRVEEIYGLEWPDIDFKDSSITVKHGGAVITKSKKERTIPLLGRLKECLLPIKKDSGPCFDSTNHKHAFPKIIKAAKLSNIGFHHFRHTYASHLAMNGVDLYTISQLLGHSNTRITEQYAYLTKDHKKAAVEKLPY
jgi:integrase